MLPIIYLVFIISVTTCCSLLVTLGPSAMISDLITLLFLEFVVFLILSMSCMHLLWSGIGDPNGDSLGHQRGWTII